MAKLTVVGSSNTDMVVKTPRFPRPGETIIGGQFHMFPGGKGANQAVAAARMGGQVAFICCLGEDQFGTKALEAYKNEGLDTIGIQLLPGIASGIALITVNEQGENEIVVASGANNELSVDQLEKNSDLIKQSNIVLTQLETPLAVVESLAVKCSQMEVPLIINPAPAQPLADEILKGLYLITPNETETQILTGVQVADEKSAARAAVSLLDKGVQNVIITMGKQGAFFMNRSDSFTVKPPQVKAVDTTAAGDVFNGALAVSLAEGMGWKEGIEMACKAAALSVTKLGAQSSAPYRKEIEKIDL